MRVIECNECGETLSAATDEELIDRLSVHLAEEHEEELEPEEVEDLVADQAYEATDS